MGAGLQGLCGGKHSSWAEAKQINYESENNVITWNPIDEHGASGTKGTKNAQPENAIDIFTML